MQTGAFNNGPEQKAMVISDCSASELLVIGKTKKQYVKDPQGLLYTAVAYGDGHDQFKGYRS